MFRTFAINFASMLVVLGILVLLWLLVTRKARAGDRRHDSIRAAGLTAWATVVSLDQTRSNRGGQFDMVLVLDVPQQGGSMKRCTITDTINLGWNLRPGDQVQVFINAANTDEVVLDKIMEPRYADARR